MAELELPSFSLGLDSDSDLELRDTTGPPNATTDETRPRCDGAEAEELKLPNEASDLENGPDPPRLLRRIRRGLRSEPKWSFTPSPAAISVDDDIEEFSSSEEDASGEYKKMPSQFHSVGSSSKIPLCRRQVNAVPSSMHSKALKEERASSGQASATLKRNCNELMREKFSTSPLRSFQLIDSDSDSPSTSEHGNEQSDILKSDHVDRTLGIEECRDLASTSNPENSRDLASTSNPENKDLWSDFRPAKIFHIPTPALDEVCKEYFQSLKSMNKCQQQEAYLSTDNRTGQTTRSSSENIDHPRDVNDSLPPAHCYFFHDDPSIRKLVRSRLRYFFPLGGANSRENRQPDGSLIDYMSQFGSGESSQKQAVQKADSKKGSRSRSKSKASSAEEIPTPGSWTNPKTSSTTPQDAGKRRVHASGKSMGHWYTAAGGKKIYVTANGEELTGQSAYRHYRKESGMAFKK